jgi:hypothetical protein
VLEHTLSLGVNALSQRRPLHPPWSMFFSHVGSVMQGLGLTLDPISASLN